MKIRQLYTFKIVCEEESITRAAERLSTTQPGLQVYTGNFLPETAGKCLTGIVDMIWKSEVC